MISPVNLKKNEMENLSSDRIVRKWFQVKKAINYIHVFSFIKTRGIINLASGQCFLNHNFNCYYSTLMIQYSSEGSLRFLKNLFGGLAY